MSTYRQELKSRFAALGIIVVIMLASLFVRLWTMQVLQGDAYAAKAENNRVREISIDAPRGEIYDRNGVALVTNRAALAVSVDPSEDTVRLLLIRSQNSDTADDPTKSEIEERFSPLADLLGMTASEVWEKVSDTRVEALRSRVVAVDVPIDVVSQLAERQTEFPAVEVDEIAVREYPQGNLAAHVLGYTGEISDKEFTESDSSAGYELGDIVGKTGIEAQYENVLQGDKGWRRIEVNASGKAQSVVSEQAAVPGRDIKLTLDIEVQRVAEKALADAIAEAHSQDFDDAKAGAAVVLDLTTGEVIAMASAPTYDPSIFLGSISTDQWEDLTDEASEYPLTNRAIMSAYPPASTFKAITGLAGLEAGVTYENKTYTCSGKWTEMGEQWPKWCWNHSGHGTISFRSGIEQSCDVVFYEIGYEFYKRKEEELQAMARSFGLGSKLGIDLPGEVKGRVPDAEWKADFNEDYPEYQMWLPGDTVNMAIGQGDLLTSPLQIASVYGAIGNGGAVMMPHLMLEVLPGVGEEPTVYEPAVAYETGVSESSLAVMHRALVDVTTEGTALGVFRGFEVTVAGKTGTAQVANKDDYAWFAAYAPAEDPKYAVAVIVEQGGHGGSVAGPAARQILSQLFGLEIEQVHTVDESR